MSGPKKLIARSVDRWWVAVNVVLILATTAFSATAIVASIVVAVIFVAYGFGRRYALWLLLMAGGFDVLHYLWIEIRHSSPLLALYLAYCLQVTGYCAYRAVQIAKEPQTLKENGQPLEKGIATF